MVGTSQYRDCLSSLLTCLEDSTSPPEDKTNAYLRLAEDLSREDKQFLDEVCNVSGKLMSVLKRDMMCSKIDLSQAALQAIGYCLYQDQIVSSLQENEMTSMIEGICNVILNSTDKNLCTRALWGLGKQRVCTHLVEKKVSLILESVEHALVNFTSPTVQKEALEVVYRLLNQLPTETITSTAGQWSKFVYPLLISSAHKIREKALGILEMGLQPILLARENIVAGLVSDLKAGFLSDLTKCFSDKKEVFVLRVWTILIAILGEALHKSGSLINNMLKIPEQGFRSALPNVQTMSYNTWICLIDNFALSSNFIGSLKKIKLLMMPLLLCSTKTVHKDIELARLQAWWHLVCTIKTNYTSVIFAEVCMPFLQYYFNVNMETCSTPGAPTKDGMELVLPVTPVTRNKTPSGDNLTPARSGSKRKVVTLNKGKFSESFIKQVMLLSCEMLMEILAVDKTEISKRLCEHLDVPILNATFFQEHELFFLATVKSALRSCASYLEESVSLSIWSSLVDRTVSLLQNVLLPFLTFNIPCLHGDRRSYNLPMEDPFYSPVWPLSDPSDIDAVLSPLFLTAHDLMTCSMLTPNLILKFLEVFVNIPTKYLLHSFTILSPLCNHGKPVFLLTDILFNQLPSFKGSYVDERFHIVFEGLIDVCLSAPSQQLSNVYTVWSSLEGFINTIANVEDLWRFWGKVTDSVSDYVTKTSDVSQGDSLDHDFTLMISLLTCPFKYLFSGGLPGATAKELDHDLANFFQLFSRCASLVATAEANTCIEEVSSSILTVVSYEKCKNTNFLDGICNMVNVMMESVDFSALANIPTLPFHSNLSPAPKAKQPRNTLGKLNSLVLLSAKILTFLYQVHQDSSGSLVVASAVMVLAGALSKLFAHLTISQQIKACIRVLAKPLRLFISHQQSSCLVSEARSADKKAFSTKFFLKIEKLWADILTCLQSRYTEPYDSNLLAAMSELLESTFCHNRRQFRNQTIIFWNATFAHSNYLDYPESLRSCLQTVLEKTPLTLPGWNKSKIPPFDSPATLQECEETTPKENIIKPLVVLAVNSPKRKHGSSSPGKLKGSFLHKAFSSDKNDALSPFKNKLESSANKRKSPAGGNVRRKLPLSLDMADDKDFVVIAPSPKKKRLLTEHQKEVIKAKKVESIHPPLYNMLDQSQDGSRFAEWSQSLSQSLASHNQGTIEAAKNVQDGTEIELQSKDLDNILNNRAEDVKDDLNNEHAQSVTTVDEQATLVNGADEIGSTNHVGEWEHDVSMSMEEDGSSPEFIPSSQSDSVRESRRSIIPFQSISMKNRLTGDSCPQPAADSDKVAPVKLVDCSEQEAQECSDDIDQDDNTTNEENVERAMDSAKNNFSKTSPISSRTRLRRKPSDAASQSPKTKAKELSNETTSPEHDSDDVLKSVKPSQIASTELDPQLCDTQILEDVQPTEPVEHSSALLSNDSDGRQEPGESQNITEQPSSPVSSVKFINSKNSTFGSPLHRPTRSFSSPAASPTTGILKRYNMKGNPDTPSPPGKTRRVSFAFPLREEKEFSNECLQDAVNTAVKAATQEEQNYTSIKATTTPTKSSKNGCVFPDLVECLTPVEQILPSLATSRWSRGLGHLVHAQNIRTIGNLSALTEDQVNKLPIRSPKVSTLRRVLRNFNETRPSKSPKGNHQRELKTIEEEGKEIVDAANIVDAVSDGTTEQHSINLEDVTREHENEEVDVLPKTTNSVVEHEAPLDTIESMCTDVELPFSAEKMLTPKRSRSFVKPTTLFDNENDLNNNDLPHVAPDDDTDKTPVEDSTNTSPLVSEDIEPSCSTVVENVDMAIEKVDILGENSVTEHVLADQLPQSEEYANGENDEMDACDTPANEESAANIISGKEENAPCITYAKEENELQEMDTEGIITAKVETDPFVEVVDNLFKLKTQEELAQLPLDTLFSCHEHLTTLLSNVASAIKSKCKQEL